MRHKTKPEVAHDTIITKPTQIDDEASHQQAGLHRQQLGRSKRRHTVAFAGAFVCIVFLRIFLLDTLPGDLYGDIAIIIDYVNGIYAGLWPTNFDLSAGPLYHYLIAPLLSLTGISYYAIKMASVLVSLATLAFTYALARDLVDETFGLLAFFCAGVSCWFLIFSRLGNSQILVPLLAIGSVYLVLRGVRRRKIYFTILAALVASGGLYTYPQSFIIPGVTGLVLLWLIWLEGDRPWNHLWIYGYVCLLGAIPFVMIVYRDLGIFQSGYIGNKLPDGSELALVLRQNIWNTLVALHIRGDNTFRSNPSDLPQLDPASGFLFLIGLIFWLRPDQRRFGPVVFIPLLLLQVPSILVRYTVEVPSASRTLGAVPFICIVVAGGLWCLHNLFQRWPVIQRVVALSLMVALLVLNGYRYFVVYADGLPNRNLAFGRVIARYIDALPPERWVVIIGCCWGSAGQPHPYAIQYDIHGPRKLLLIPIEKTTCVLLDDLPRPTTVIWSVKNWPPSPDLAPCFANVSPTLHLAPNGEPVFQSADLPP